jgi:hypothetical protein
MLVFHAYINEMHGSRSKVPRKYPVRQRCAEGFNSGVEGLMYNNLTLFGRVVIHNNSTENIELSHVQFRAG